MELQTKLKRAFARAERQEFFYMAISNTTDSLELKHFGSLNGTIIKAKKFADECGLDGYYVADKNGHRVAYGSKVLGKWCKGNL